MKLSKKETSHLAKHISSNILVTNGTEDYLLRAMVYKCHYYIILFLKVN